MTPAGGHIRIVVVDTNVLWPNENDVEHGVGWQELLIWSDNLPDVVFIVPEVVVLELARQESDRKQKVHSQTSNTWRKTLGALRYAGLEVPESLCTAIDFAPLMPPALSDIAARIRRGLRERGVVVKPVPEGLPHADMLRKSLLRHPPFDHTDKGYRDALIWETVCELVGEATDGVVVVLVTDDNDYRDGKSDALHPALIDEVNTRMHASVTVSVARDLRSAVGDECAKVPEEAGTPVNEDVDDVPVTVEAQNVVELVERAIVDRCERIFYGESLRIDNADGDSEPLLFGEEIDPEVSDPTVEEVIPRIETLVLDEHESFDGGTQIGSAAVEATVEFEGFMYKADYYGSDHEWHLLDGDWNRHYVKVSGTFDTELEFRYVADPSDLLALEFVPVAG
jgi:hypothetical protein